MNAKTIVILIELKLSIISYGLAEEVKEFKPISWKAYGLDGPSLDFIAGSPEWAGILKRSYGAVLVEFAESKNLPLGTSLSMDGVTIVNSYNFSKELKKRMLSLMINPNNYGESRPYIWQADDKIDPPKRDLYGLELTDGKSFVRFYFFGGYRYCNLYCSIPSEEQTRSMTLIVSPKIRKEIRTHLKKISNNKD